MPVPDTFSLSHSLFLFRSFVLSSCRFPFDSCIAFFVFTFASLLSLVADSVILLFRLGATPPPALLASLKYAYSACVLFSLAFLMLTSFYFFLLFLPLFDFNVDIICFHPVFFLWVLWCLIGFGFCCDSFSILV